MIKVESTINLCCRLGPCGVLLLDRLTGSEISSGYRQERKYPELMIRNNSLPVVTNLLL